MLLSKASAVARRAAHVARTQGFKGLLHAARRRVTGGRARCLDEGVALVRGRRGLEIGGPSELFSAGGALPLYPHVASLDGCNFSHRTLWEGELGEGTTFRYDPRRPPGTQWIREAIELTDIPDGQYEVVLSSHTLEHVANPVRALLEWIRVLGQEGALILVLPHKETTFDHLRATTDLEHLWRDHAEGVDEGDRTHLADVLAHHDLSRDPGVGSRSEFEARCRDNERIRAIHHHVFDTRLATALVASVGLEIAAVEALLPSHIVVMAEKPASWAPGRRAAVPGALETWLERSPFEADRRPRR